MSFLAAVVSDDAMQALSDALASGEPVLAVVAVVALALVTVLKLFGKSIPLVDPILKVVLGIARSIKLKKPEPLPEEKQGLKSVVPIEDQDEQDPK